MSVVSISLIVNIGMTIGFWVLAQWVVNEYITLPEDATESMKNSYALTKILGFWIPIVIGAMGLFRPLMMIVDFMAGLSNIKNIEKRTNMLKKMGVEKFIESTEAVFIDSNDRGIELYSSDKIIENKVVRFLVYRDTSTNEPYISYVKPDCESADEGMAWKHHLSIEQYRRLKVES